MTFFKKYQNNKIESNNYTEYKRNIVKEGNLIDNDVLDIDVESNIDDTLDKIKIAENYIKDKIRNSPFTADPFFDSELYKNLDNLHSFISQYIPDYPKYYDDKGNINPQAFLDARDLLENEFPLSVDEILNSTNNLSGVVNDNKINIENGFQIDELGNVYNPSREIIFSNTEPSIKIKFIDLLNNKVITDNGIRINAPKNFIENNILNNEFLDNTLKEQYKKKKEMIDKVTKENFTNSFTVKENEKEIIAIVQGVPIYSDEAQLINLEVDELFLGDIYEDEKIDFIEQLKKYKVEYDNFGLCNFKDIPYAELNSLLFWGGGERGVKPLASQEISSKDIQFKADGTVYYSGANSTISTSRPGCPSKTFKTGHVCMYSNSNKMGLKRSIIQYIYMFCNTFGIFNANIPPLIGYASFKVFPGLCIGGLLEKILCGWQEKISKRINDMFQCVPAKMITDASQSGFENETFPYGCSVSSLSELDKVKSCKVGDRYVVEIVPTEITGAKTPACGVFIFDPQNTMSNLFRWKYKNWRGKPFNPNDNNNVIKGYTNMFDNPIIQDILMNTNALGTDSISRKLMELQYAFLKKQALLSVSDVSLSMNEIIGNAINEMLGKLTNQISSYLIMESAHTKYISNTGPESKYNNYEKIGYINEFQKHFAYLTDSNILKLIPLEKCKRILKINSSNGNGTTNSVTIEYYDFSGYNKNEYLVPSRNNVSYYDAMMFAYMFIPSEQLIEIYKNNIEYLEAINSNTSQYKTLKTIKEFINQSENKTVYEKDINDTLNYIQADLNYNGYVPEAFEQVKKRCNYTIEKANILGGVIK